MYKNLLGLILLLSVWSKQVSWLIQSLCGKGCKRISIPASWFMHDHDVSIHHSEESKRFHALRSAWIKVHRQSKDQRMKEGQHGER